MDDAIARAALARKGSPYLNASQAGHYLGLSTKTLARLRQSGTGPAFRQLSWSVRYHIDDLTAWSQGKTSTKSPRLDEGEAL